MIKEKNLVLTRENKKSIVYDIYYTKDQTQKPIVIFCHGYKGFKDWGAWHLVAETFAREGFFFLKLNFSHNGGTVSQPLDFPDLDAFGKNNFIKELDDLEDIISLIKTNEEFKKEVDLTNISLIGHSRGGGIVLIKAEENGLIKNVITWAGVSDFKARFQESSENFKQWQKTGITFVENGRTHQQMPHEFQFYTNFKENEKRLTIKRAVENLKTARQLIIHGSEDPTVSMIEAHALKRWNPKSNLVTIDNADHVFGSSHPWTHYKLPKDLFTAVNKSILFINKSKNT